jgi:hypothetical protein
VSITQPDDLLLSLHEELAENEGTPLKEDWRSYLEYMDVAAEVLSPRDKGATLKKLFLADARSRPWERPPVFPLEFGTPAEFRTRCAESHVEYVLRRNRRKQTIRFIFYPLPPYEFEDLDEAGEMAGHWEGLTWIPDTPKKSGV